MRRVSPRPLFLPLIDAHRRVDLRRPLEKAAEMASGCSRMLFTGVGTGLNATIPAVYYLMSRGRAAEYIDTTEPVYNLYPGMAGSLLVLNTRSGETAELIRAAELARQAGVPSIAVTNEPASTVARLADVCLPTYSRWDDLVVISAFGGMLVSELSEALQIHLPKLPAYLLPLVEIIPCQVLAHDLAQRAGLTPGSVRYIQKVITGEEGIPGNR